MSAKQRVGSFVKQHGVTILSFVSSAGVVGTSVLTAKGAIKADKLWGLKMKPMKRERWETCFDRLYI